MSKGIVDNWRRNTATKMWQIYISFAVLFRGVYCIPLINTAEHSNCTVVIKRFGEQVKTLEVKWNSTIHLICDASCVGPRPLLGLTWFYRDKNQSKLINIKKLFPSPKFETYTTKFRRVNELVIRGFGPNEETNFICRGSIKTQRLEAKVALIGTDCLLKYNFRCKLGNKCIDRAYLCNQHNECPNGEDEVGCGSVQTDGILTIPDIQPSYAGNYVYTGTTDTGRTGSAVTRPDVEVKPAISPRLTVSPSRLVARSGENIILRCSPTGSGPFNIEWSKVNGVLSPRASENEGVLEIQQVTSADAGRYRCVATSASDSSEGYAVVEITVPPTVRAVEREYSVQQNAVVELRCDFTGSPEPTVRWDHESGELPLQHRVQDGVLTINNVQPKDSGRYICTATNAAGTARDYVFVTVSSGPVINGGETRIDTQIVNVGDRVEMECIVAGTPLPTIRWSRDDGPLPASAIRGDGILIIPDARLEDAGTYTCTAINQAGSVQSKVVLYVRARPLISVPQSSMTAALGDSVSIGCEASGYPSPQITWYRKNGQMPSEYTIIDGNLKIQRVKTEDAGTYICSAQNQYGQSDASVDLKIGVVTEAPPAVCTADQYKCANGECVDGRYLCDGQYNCYDRSDEGNCPNVVCLSDEFRCVNQRKCVLIAFRCNGIPDCEDGSDEAECAKCRGDQFQCADGNCVEARMKCNGTPQCEDGSDERNCPRCPPNNFMCETTSQLECVDVSLVCDRFPDCTDGSDEVGCSSCRIDQFTCTDGNCVEGNMRCDGIAQCEDRSDEIGCHGAWSEWTNISHCYARSCNISCMIRKGPCDKGQMKQIRFCNNPSPGYGGRRCHGQVLRIVECENYVEPGWSEWGPVTCDKDCRSSENDTVSGYRRRTCNNPPPIHEKDTCCGYDIIDTEEDSNICNDLPLCIYTTAPTTATSSTTKVTGCS